MTPCPCLSNLPFASCCQPILNGTPAPTAEALMRSRYSAYAEKDAAYLHRTTHTSTRKEHPVKEILKWAKRTNWLKLEVLRTEKGMENDVEGIVEFKAYFTEKDHHIHVLHEVSAFVKEESEWYYVNGEH
ncbi:MAG: SEC-C motif-containing protein [Flavobacteriales bacterium]|jgi:SEC-C motif-containing protein